MNYGAKIRPTCAEMLHSLQLFCSKCDFLLLEHLPHIFCQRVKIVVPMHIKIAQLFVPTHNN